MRLLKMMYEHFKTICKHKANLEDYGEDIAFVHQEADARLIAAAPEMYSLLKQVAYGTCDDCMPMLVSARKLLAHIDGK